MATASSGLGRSPFRDLDEIDNRVGYLEKLIGANPTYYPWAILPPDGKAIDEVNTIALPALNVETVVLSYIVPKGYNSFFSAISNNYLGPSFNPGLPSLIWRIRNGAALVGSKFVDGYAKIVVEYGTTNFPREIAGIHGSSGQTFLYTVTNQDAALPVGNSQVVCCFHGSRWPQQREKLMKLGARK